MNGSRPNKPMHQAVAFGARAVSEKLLASELRNAFGSGTFELSQ
jgi:hypothetical protein